MVVDLVGKVMCVYHRFCKLCEPLLIEAAIDLKLPFDSHAHQQSSTHQLDVKETNTKTFLQFHNNPHIFQKKKEIKRKKKKILGFK